MKTGLVLEGGAMRGMFTAGVLDVLMEHGIVLDGAIGVSAGAVFGCNYKSHQIGRTIRYNTEYCTDKRYASFGNLLRTGNLYSENFCYHEVPEKLDPFGRMQKTGTFPCARSAPEIHPEPLLPVYSDFAEKQERKCQKTLKTGGQIRYTR